MILILCVQSVSARFFQKPLDTNVTNQSLTSGIVAITIAYLNTKQSYSISRAMPSSQTFAVGLALP